MASLIRVARKPPITVPVDATVWDAIEIMVNQRVGAVAIVDDGKLKGIFTERDVVRKIVQEGLDPKATAIAEVMTTEMITESAETTVKDGLQVMSEHKIRHLPVVDENNTLEGMVSLRFLMHNRVEAMLNEVQSLEAYMSADGPGG